MKKMLILVLLFLIIIPDVFAIEIKLSKDSYQPQETLQAEITGNFIALKSENILIYENKIPRPIPVISDLTRQNNIYYFYAILPNKQNNFSLKIKNSEYISNGKIKSEPLIKNFEIKKTNQSVLTINPGFVVAINNFKIKIKSPFENQKINVKFEGIENSQNISLTEGSEKILEFSKLNKTKINLKINKYNIPIFTIKSENNITYKKQEIRFIPDKIKANITSGEKYFFKLILENLKNKNFTNITFSNNLNAEINPNKASLMAKQKSFINITIPVSKKEKNNISGEIILKYNNKQKILPVFFQIIENKEEINLEKTSITETNECRDIGEICELNEDCDGQTTASLEGSCCLGKCIEKKEFNYGLIIGIILLLIVIAVIVFLYFKMKKKKNLKSAKDIFKKKSEKYNGRTMKRRINKKFKF